MVWLEYCEVRDTGGRVYQGNMCASTRDLWLMIRAGVIV